MKLHDYLAILRKRWVSILLITVLAVAGAVAASLLATPTYQAIAQVFVSVRTGGSTSDLLQGSNFTQNQVKSYTDLVTSERVLIPVIEQLKLPTTPDELAKSITADSPLDTVLINVTVTDPDPKVASDVANATANSLGTEVTALEKPADGQPSPVAISTSRTATAPTVPSAPNKRLNVALGLLMGLALGVAQAFLREMLDTKVRNEADVHQVTEADVIASIGYDDDAAKHSLVVQHSPHSHRSEAFRRLQTNLQFLDIDERPKTIVVTSSVAGEGKSSTVINLAITLADSGSRVVLVDADLRRPSVAKYMGLEGGVGLTTVLIGQAALADVLQLWGDGSLHVLASGQTPPNPTKLLRSRSLAELLEVLNSRYDIVLIDAPPLLPVTDAAILAKLTGGALVVVGANMLSRQQLAGALASLETVGAPVLGVVLNRLSHKQSDSYSYSYYDYSSPSETGNKAKRKWRHAAPPDPTQQDSARTRTGRSPSASDESEVDVSVNSVLGSSPPRSAAVDQSP